MASHLLEVGPRACLLLVLLCSCVLLQCFGPLEDAEVGSADLLPLLLLLPKLKQLLELDATQALSWPPKSQQERVGSAGAIRRTVGVGAGRLRKVSSASSLRLQKNSPPYCCTPESLKLSRCCAACAQRSDGRNRTPYFMNRNCPVVRCGLQKDAATTAGGTTETKTSVP